MTSRALNPAALALSALALGSCGGGGGATATAPPAATQTQASAPSTTQQHTTTSPPPHSQTHKRHRHNTTAPRHPKPPPVPPGVATTLHAYIAALDDRNGDALCGLFAPGALDVLDLPEGSGCSGLSDSIGYAGPHGLPVWTRAELQRIDSVVSNKAAVRATVRIVDHYRNNPQPSYEDDVIFLARSGSDWLIEKPSITIYRAIGTPDPPPSVLAAPSG